MVSDYFWGHISHMMVVGRANQLNEHNFSSQVRVSSKTEYLSNELGLRKAGGTDLSSSQSRKVTASIYISV